MECTATSCHALHFLFLRLRPKSPFCRSAIIVFALLLAISSSAQTLFKHGHLRVTPDGHALQFEDGTPFFWLGDTAGELFHRLTKEEIKTYFENRAAKGFNVIQAVVLAEFSGLTKPNRYGDVPLFENDPAIPIEKYFAFVDQVISLAASENLFTGLLPTWGDKVTPKWRAGPAVFNPDNAYSYGLFLGRRYAKTPNILWILGGDRPAIKDSAD